VPRLLEISPDVATALGDAVIDRITHDRTLGAFECAICGQPGRLAPASLPAVGRPTAALIAARYRVGATVGATAVRFAHTACSPSARLNITGDPVIRPQAPARARCWLRTDTGPQGGAPTPVLLVSVDPRVFGPRPDGEPVDRYTAALYDAGFQHVTSDPDQHLHPVPGLALTLAGAGRATLALPAGVLFDGVLDRPARWDHAAHDAGAVTVITGTGLAVDAADPPELARTVSAPDRHAGPLVAGLAALHPDPPGALCAPSGREPDSGPEREAEQEPDSEPERPIRAGRPRW
jgi:hypothetical protein